MERDTTWPRSACTAARPTKAVANFPVSGEPVPRPVVHWLGRIKGAAARVNAELGLLDPKLADADRRRGRRDRRRRARRPVPDRRLPDRLGHLVEHERQRGHRRRWPARACTPTTTSTWASRPTTSSRQRRAPRRARRGDEHAAAGARSSSSARSTARRGSFKNIVKSGRTHLMDAVPVTLGQEFAGYAAQVRLGQERVEAALVHVRQIPLGGTATGTGLNTHPKFAARVRRELSRQSKLQDRAAGGPVRGAGQPRRAGRAVGRAEGRRRLADQDRQRPRADGLGPARRHRRAASCPSCRRARRSCPARSTR